LYDADCGICTRIASLLRRVDRDGALELLPAQAADDIDAVPDLATRLRALQVRDIDGGWLCAGAAAVRIAEAIPVLKPAALAARQPLLRDLVEPAYALVARNRHRISRWIGARSCAIDAASR
jgi:predicted DCC family thiol-disulfide oxidoreductase YuxK